MEYINCLHYKVIFSLIDAANFLGIEPLLSLALAWVAFVLKGTHARRGWQWPCVVQATERRDMQGLPPLRTSTSSTLERPFGHMPRLRACAARTVWCVVLCEVVVI